MELVDIKSGDIKMNIFAILLCCIPVLGVVGALLIASYEDKVNTVKRDY